MEIKNELIYNVKESKKARKQERALYKAAWQGMITLADKGYTNSGIGVLTPVKGPSPCPDDTQMKKNELEL